MSVIGTGSYSPIRIKVTGVDGSPLANTAVVAFAWPHSNFFEPVLEPKIRQVSIVEPLTLSMCQGVAMVFVCATRNIYVWSKPFLSCGLSAYCA